LFDEKDVIEEYQVDEEHFSSKAELVEYLLLRYLLNTNEPVGSWVLKVVLELRGVEVSTATIGRILKGLDSKKYTKLVGSQGRTITSKGASYFSKVSEKVHREQLQKRLMNAAQPHNLEELIDLLRARRALECETARLAALRADQNDIAALERSMDKHEECVIENNDPTSLALDFHSKVAQASKNRFLIAALDILIYEELKIEYQIAELLLRERGSEYAIQHRLIAEAIKKRDSVEASRQMGIHIDTLIKAIEEQCNMNLEKGDSSSTFIID